MTIGIRLTSVRHAFSESVQQTFKLLSKLLETGSTNMDQSGVVRVRGR